MINVTDKSEACNFLWQVGSYLHPFDFKGIICLLWGFPVTSKGLIDNGEISRGRCVWQVAVEIEAADTNALIFRGVVRLQQLRYLQANLVCLVPYKDASKHFIKSQFHEIGERLAALSREYRISVSKS